MTLPISASEPLVIHGQPAASVVELAHALAHQAQARQGSVTFVYAPTTITHQHAAPTTSPHSDAPSHPGISVDLTGYGEAYAPPACVAPLPAIPETRTLAPLAFLLCGWSTLAAALCSAVTGGNPAALAATIGALTGTVASVAAMYRGRS